MPKRPPRPAPGARDPLDPRDREILEEWGAGVPLPRICERTGLGPDQVRRIIRRARKRIRPR